MAALPPSDDTDETAMRDTNSQAAILAPALDGEKLETGERSVATVKQAAGI